MKKTGINAASGIAIAKAFIYRNETIDVTPVQIDNIEIELERLEKALAESDAQLGCIYEQALSELGEAEAAIFDAHKMLLADPGYTDAMRGDIQNGYNAEYAVQNATELFAGMFEVMDDPYFAARAADLRDVGNRVLHNLAGIPLTDISHLSEDIILLAHDLAPSDTATMDKAHVKGFATNVGSRTSHTAIMARSLEIPAVLGLHDITEAAQDGDWIIVDGIAGEVILDPDEATLKAYQEKQADYFAKLAELAELKDLPAETTDGHRVELAGNIGKPADVEGVLNNGGEGIGLYRTEFLYMDCETMPTEDKQFVAYKSVAESFPDGGVIIRTMDIGGDKKLPYLPMEEELNPFLGLRAVRLSFTRMDLFKTQLRAILRASAYGKIRVMFPMISGVAELKQAKAIVAECKAELDGEGIAYDHDIEVGVMIEIPSAALTADIIAKEAAFFSIGTNDLCQYTLAVDRMNQNVAYLYDPLHPAVLRLIKNVIDASNAQPGCFTGMCGEMAGDPAATLILLGLGLHEFSMSASSIPEIKKIIRSVSYEQAKQIAAEALQLADGKAIRALVEQHLQEILPA